MSPKRIALLSKAVAIIVLASSLMLAGSARSNACEPRWGDDGKGISLDYKHLEVYGPGPPAGCSEFQVRGQQQMPDGLGGAVFAWSVNEYYEDEDYCSCYDRDDFDVYAQRVSQDGYPMWGDDGAVVCGEDGCQLNPAMVADSNGGYLLAWEDYRDNDNGDLFAQRMDESGATAWGPGGVPICSGNKRQRIVKMVPDGKDGAIIAWQDNRNGNWDIYAQRVDSQGVCQWAINGIPVCNDLDDVSSPLLVSDGRGGAIVVWQDYYGSYHERESDNIYAQRIDSTGACQWGTEGAVICDAYSYQENPQVAERPGGGATVTWQDYRGGTWSIYVQDVNNEGDTMFASNGVRVAANGETQLTPQIVYDGGGAIVIAWQQGSPEGWDIYAQRLCPSSRVDPRWPSDGLPVCVTPESQYRPNVVSDETGGFVVAWKDGSDSRVHTQKVDSGGSALWEESGIAVLGSMYEEKVEICSDRLGGAILSANWRYSWGDSRAMHGYCIWGLEANRIADHVPLATSRSWAKSTIGVAEPSCSWYFAEGSTGNDGQACFDTWILLQNPSDDVANVKLYYQTPEGEGPRQEFIIGPSRRRTVNVADALPGEWSVSTRVESDLPIIAERAMYWNGRLSAHQSIGASDPSKKWFFSEGSTGNRASGSFETWILLQNPSDDEAQVKLSFQTEDGPIDGPTLDLDPGTRETIDLEDFVPSTPSVATSVKASVPIVAERAVYLNTPEAERQAACVSIGANDTSPQWFLAEGSTLGNLDTWILIQNPSEKEAEVKITFETDSGKLEGPTVEMEPYTRETVEISRYIRSYCVSTHIESDEPVVAERAIFYRGNMSAHGSIGVEGPSRCWYLAEGSTGEGFETWILIQNPGESSTKVRLTHQTPLSEIEGQEFVLAGDSRVSINLADIVQDNWSISTVVQSDEPVVVERTMYGKQSDRY